MVAFCGHMMAQDKIWRIAPPRGFIRKETSGFGDYLRNLPLKPLGTKVKLYDGSVKGWQGGAYAVIDMEIGASDLQMAEDYMGNKAILVAQSYMPAQDIHIVTNLKDKAKSPWYIINRTTKDFNFPEYHFNSSQIMRFQ